jgi:hypothetical protein
MNTAVTSIDSTTGGVKISWSSPVSNGEQVTAYKIEIHISGSTGTLWYEDSSCDGSNSVIFTNKYCIVPMSDLIASPYSLAFGDLVQVRVSAYNSDGFGPVSTTNTAGATIKTIPSAVSTPTRGSDTSTTKLQVEWTGLAYPDTGDSTIYSYNLVWDAGTGTTNQDLVGLSTYYTSTSYSITTGITSG